MLWPPGEQTQPARMLPVRQDHRVLEDHPVLVTVQDLSFEHRPAHDADRAVAVRGEEPPRLASAQVRVGGLRGVVHQVTDVGRHGERRAAHGQGHRQQVCTQRASRPHGRSGAHRRRLTGGSRRTTPLRLPPDGLAMPGLAEPPPPRGLAPSAAERPRAPSSGLCCAHARAPVPAAGRLHPRRPSGHLPLCSSPPGGTGRRAADPALGRAGPVPGSGLTPALSIGYAPPAPGHHRAPHR